MHMQCAAFNTYHAPRRRIHTYPLLQPCAVPCLSRASDLEKYDSKSEFALGGDEEGWVATHKDPGSAAAGSSAAAAAQEDDIPDLDAEENPAAAAGSAGGQGGAAAAAVDDDDVPDISELELVEPDDEVSGLHALALWLVGIHVRIVFGRVSR
jgi:hypothetical protein